MAEVSALSSPCAASRQPFPREGAKLPHPPTVIAFAAVASRCPASRQAPPRVVGIPAVSGLSSRCAASCQVPPRESANTAPAAVSKSASAATTIALLAVATPVGAHPKAPRRTAPNPHAIAEKPEVTEAPTTAETFAPNGHASLQATPRSAPRSAFLDVHTSCHTCQGSPDAADHRSHAALQEPPKRQAASDNTCQGSPKKAAAASPTLQATSTCDDARQASPHDRSCAAPATTSTCQGSTKSHAAADISPQGSTPTEAQGDRPRQSCRAPGSIHHASNPALQPEPYLQYRLQIPFGCYRACLRAWLHQSGGTTATERDQPRRQ